MIIAILLTILFLASLVALLVGFIKPSLFKIKNRKQALLIFGGTTIVLFILIGITAPEQKPIVSEQTEQIKTVAETTPKTEVKTKDTTTPTTQTKQEKVTFSSPDKELLFEISLGLGNARQSPTLSTEQSKELADIDLATQDVWNKEMGYSVYLSPTNRQKLTDFQIIEVLKIIQEFRKTKNDKWFDVIIFDDPAIARTSRKGALEFSKLSDAVFCSEIFSHYRGTYSWNPTNQHEGMSITSGCDWKSIK